MKFLEEEKSQKYDFQITIASPQFVNPIGKRGPLKGWAQIGAELDEKNIFNVKKQRTGALISDPNKPNQQNDRHQPAGA